MGAFYAIFGLLWFVMWVGKWATLYSVALHIHDGSYGMALLGLIFAFCIDLAREFFKGAVNV